MATVYAIASISIFDDLGVTVPHDIFVSLDDTATLASLVTQIQDYWTLVKPLSDGAAIVGRVTIQLAPTDFNAVPAAGKAVDTTGLFTFNQAGSIYKYSVDIPAVADAILSGTKINNSNTDVAAWVEWWASAHSGVRGVTKFHALTAGFYKSQISTRKHRKPLTRNSTNLAG